MNARAFNGFAWQLGQIYDGQDHLEVLWRLCCNMPKNGARAHAVLAGYSALLVKQQDRIESLRQLGGLLRLTWDQDAVAEDDGLELVHQYQRRQRAAQRLNA